MGIKVNFKLEGMDYSPDQQDAVGKIQAWFEKRRNQTPLTMGGYAGTGKTTLMGNLRKHMKVDSIAYCAYTGKARQMLYGKLKESGSLDSRDSVTTIHKLIYHFDPETKKSYRKERWELDNSLIIVDEASMVTRDIYNDLCYFGIPLLFVGDHGQLPPIGDRFNLMENPIIKLEEIHRQAKGSKILDVAQMAREHGEIPMGIYSDKVRKVGYGDVDFATWWTEDSLVLTAKNPTRVTQNHKIRAMRGIDPTGPPVVGDLVVCLKNNKHTGVYNGMIGTITGVSRPKNTTYKKNDVTVIGLNVMFPDGDRYSGYALLEQFGLEQKWDPFFYSENVDLWDFGYALTVHKAQGSQAERVLVIEEKMRNTDHKRWLYTAVTRASDDLTIRK